MARTLLDTVAAIDAQDADAFLAGLTPDVEFTFGNNPAAHGREEVRGAVQWFWGTIAALRHEVRDLWEVEPDVTVVNLFVHYTRLDGGQVTVPCVNVLRWDGDLVAKWQIVIDLAPVFAPAEEGAAEGSAADQSVAV